MNIFRKSVRIFSYVVIGFGFVGLVICCCHSDKLVITKYDLKNNKIGEETFKAAVISDYHHRDLKFDNTNMIEAINNLDNPDAIFFTGDLIDQHVKNLDDVNKIIDASYEKTHNLYFVTGNHEEYAPLWPELQGAFGTKVKYIDNKTEVIKKGDKEIHIFGLKDPRFDLHGYKNGKLDYGKSKEYLDAFKPNINPNNINILLAHRPEIIDLYAQYDFDYIFAGHSHGGQFRIGNWTPLSLAFKGKTFPKGEYKVNNSTMIVSAGLGYAAMFPLRVNCNPEIVTVTITK